MRRVVYVAAAVLTAMSFAYLVKPHVKLHYPQLPEVDANKYVSIDHSEIDLDNPPDVMWGSTDAAAMMPGVAAVGCVGSTDKVGEPGGDGGCDVCSSSEFMASCNGACWWEALLCGASDFGKTCYVYDCARDACGCAAGCAGHCGHVLGQDGFGNTVCQ